MEAHGTRGHREGVKESKDLSVEEARHTVPVLAIQPGANPGRRRIHGWENQPRG